jgi:hypothetical protein
LTFVEAVGVGSLKIGGELDSIATGTPGDIDGGIEELRTNAPAAEVRIDVHGFNLRAETAPSLEVSEHHELAHPDDFAIQLGDEHITTTGCLDIGERRQVRRQVGGVFFPLLQRTIFQERDEAFYVAGGGAANNDGTHSEQYASRHQSHS